MQQVGAASAIDKLITDFFSTLDNRDGRVPDMETLLGFFADKAVIARASGAQIELFTAIEFARPRIELLRSGRLVDFHEAETQGTTNVFGTIATHTSRYRKAGLLDGKPYAGQGTKTFQLVALECGWRILSLAWIDDEA
jgi:hypothetical protein